jgi:hypothetical protein
VVGVVGGCFPEPHAAASRTNDRTRFMAGVVARPVSNFDVSSTVPHLSQVSHDQNIPASSERASGTRDRVGRTCDR